MANKNGFVAAMDGLPWIVKVLLCIPVLDIVWAVYRIVKGISKKDAFMVVVGVLWIIPGCVFCWIIDIICTLFLGRPKFFA